jgi:hypothetical protein
MAVVLVTNIKRFIGLSSDTKPTDAPAGSEFYERNTGARFIWDGSNWTEDISLIYALSQVLGG